MTRAHVILQTPKDLESILATVELPMTPQRGDYVEGIEMGEVSKKVRGIVSEVIEAE